MNVNVMGVEMTPDLRAWNHDQRRIGSLLVLGLAALLLVGGVVTWFLAEDAAEIGYWVLAGVLLALLVLQAALYFVGAAASATAGATPHHDGPAEPHAGPAMGGGAPQPQARSLTLRCGDCSTVFDVTDTGERPLHHVCPGCGAEGVLRLEDAPVEEASRWAPSESPTPEAAPAPDVAAASAPAAPVVKKLKLRCGGCREVFSIEDAGERPLRRPCPHCGRVGEVR